jgi:hypothetical protein
VRVEADHDRKISSGVGGKESQGDELGKVFDKRMQLPLCREDVQSLASDNGRSNGNVTGVG